MKSLGVASPYVCKDRSSSGHSSGEKMAMYRINQSHGCKPLTCDHLYGAKYGTEGTLLHVVRPQWHPCPRCAPTMAVHVVRPQWMSTLCAHNGCPRCVPTCNGCPRCAPTMASLSTLCAHNGALVHVVRKPSSS